MGWAVFAPLLAPVMRLFVLLFWRLGPGPSLFLPARVRALLASRVMRDDLARLVASVADYTSLSNSERRELALEFVAHWLTQHGVDLTEHELSLLVELVYGWVKRHHSGGTPRPLIRSRKPS